MELVMNGKRETVALLRVVILSLGALLARGAEVVVEAEVRNDAYAEKKRINPITEIKRPPQAVTFESWPVPAQGSSGMPTNQPRTIAEIAVPEVTPMPPGVDEKQLFSFRAENLDIKTALALFARANGLNIVPDLDVTGVVTLDVANLPLRRMLQALLEAHDFAWTIEEGLIRVHSTQTRSFTVDYLRLIRTGMGVSSVTLSSGSSTGAGGQGGGGGGQGAGAGGGLGGGGAGGGAGGAGGAGATANGSAVNLTSQNPVDFWKDLEEELGRLLTEKGKATLAINKTAGIIELSDRPNSIKRVERYLERLKPSVSRQVEIEAKLYDVTLNDQFQFGIDWTRIASAFGGALSFAGTPTVVAPAGGFPLKTSAIQIGYSDEKTSVALRALKEQGDVSVLSQPRIRTLNNQTALIKVGVDTPFFSQTIRYVNVGGDGNNGSVVVPVQEEASFLITIGTILSITPQISSDDMITIDVSPVITSLVGREVGPTGRTTAPVLDIKQASSIIRVQDGQTIILGGLIQTATGKTVRKIPLLGDIPKLGELFTGRVNSKQKKELVIFLTPRIVREVAQN
jgi:MSHA biogenesis protein MshL